MQSCIFFVLTAAVSLGNATSYMDGDEYVPVKKKKRPKKSAFDAALKILKRREHSEHELKQKLYDAGYWTRDIQEALGECRRHHYLSDDRYVEMMIRSRIMQGNGKKRIENELVSEKRVPSSVVSRVMEALDVDWRLQAKLVCSAKKKALMSSVSISSLRQLPSRAVTATMATRAPAEDMDVDTTSTSGWKAGKFGSGSAGSSSGSSPKKWSSFGPKKWSNSFGSGRGTFMKQQKTPEQKIHSRLTAFMQRRGFSGSEVTAALAACRGSDNKDQEQVGIFSSSADDVIRGTTGGSLTGTSIESMISNTDTLKKRQDKEALLDTLPANFFESESPTSASVGKKQKQKRRRQFARDEGAMFPPSYHKLQNQPSKNQRQSTGLLNAREFTWSGEDDFFQSLDAHFSPSSGGTLGEAETDVMSPQPTETDPTEQELQPQPEELEPELQFTNQNMIDLSHQSPRITSAPSLSTSTTTSLFSRTDDDDEDPHPLRDKNKNKDGQRGTVLELQQMIDSLQKGSKPRKFESIALSLTGRGSDDARGGRGRDGPVIRTPLFSGVCRKADAPMLSRGGSRLNASNHDTGGMKILGRILFSLSFVFPSCLTLVLLSN